MTHTDPTTTFTYTRTAVLAAVRVDQNQGFPRHRRVTYRVEVEFAYPELIGIVPGEAYADETVDGWLDNYLTDTDLNQSAPFAPTGGMLARYLLNALRAHADTITAVTLTEIQQDGTVGVNRWAARTAS
jgi:hypothetical protein